MAAWLIDLVIITSYYYLVLALINPNLDMHEGGKTAEQLLFIILPVIVYQLAFEIFMNGQTPGKRAVGIKIISLEGNEPGWSQYIIRWMLSLGNIYLYVLPEFLLQSPWFLLLFLFFYIPDVIVMAFSGKMQRIGDLAAGSAVIDATYSADIQETIYQEIVQHNYTVVFPQVMQLTDKDINGIRSLLDVAKPGKDTDAYTARVVVKIKKVLQAETTMDDLSFLEQLLRDYNYLSGR
jgi:uncharacterized RDD family membrane protein YckC